MTPEEQVEAFEELVAIQRTKILENTHKGGWRNNNVLDLKLRVNEELDELQNILEWPIDDPTSGVLRAADILREAADVANMIMMLADVAAANARTGKRPLVRISNRVKW